MSDSESNETLTRMGRALPWDGCSGSFGSPRCSPRNCRSGLSAGSRAADGGRFCRAFRDSSGKVGLLDAHCPHRAGLFFGRNEEGGLRCVYHGWKFSVAGEILDMPSEPQGSPMRCNPNLRARRRSVREAGGIIWAYLGPQNTCRRPTWNS